jgi:hypothetical protein
MLRLAKARFYMHGLLLVSCSALTAQSANYWAHWDQSNESNFASVNHSELDFVLRTYVVTNHPSGINRFRYGMVSAGHKERLENYITSIANLDPRDYSRAEQKVYWINLYNALTINLVLDNYPLDSIRDIAGSSKSGPWDVGLVSVAGKSLSLDDIEHRILRPIWRDHKIHFALVCASLGCPSIQPVAFTRANNRKLLAKAGRDFVNHRRGLHFEKGQLQVSRIFDWYEKDFAADQKTLLKVFAHYVEDRKALYLLGFNGEIQYNYDWRINAP